jgi:hypothetical protein
MSSLRAWKFGAICGIVYRSTANRARPEAPRAPREAPRLLNDRVQSHIAPNCHARRLNTLVRRRWLAATHDAAAAAPAAASCVLPQEGNTSGAP